MPARDYNWRFIEFVSIRNNNNNDKHPQKPRPPTPTPTNNNRVARFCRLYSSKAIPCCLRGMRPKNAVNDKQLPEWTSAANSFFLRDLVVEGRLYTATTDAAELLLDLPWFVDSLSITVEDTVAGINFQKEFIKRGVGVEDMDDDQQKFWDDLVMSEAVSGDNDAHNSPFSGAPTPPSGNLALQSMEQGIDRVGSTD